MHTDTHTRQAQTLGDEAPSQLKGITEATVMESIVAPSSAASSSSSNNGVQPMNLVTASNSSNGGDRKMAVEPQTRELRKPIRIYQGTYEEKRKMFIQAIGDHEMLADGLNRSKSNDVTEQLEKALAANNEELYHMLHDPELRKIYKEQKKCRENSFAIIANPFQIAVKNNDTEFVTAFANDYFMHEGSDRDLTINLMHKAAEEQNPEMMLTLLSIKDKGVHTAEQALDNYFLFDADSAQKELTAVAFKTYQETLSLIRQRRKNEATSLCNLLSTAVPQLPLEVCAIITQMRYPTEKYCNFVKNRAAANTVIHPDLKDAIENGNGERFDALINGGWVTANNRSHLPQAFKLAAENNQREMLDKLVQLTPFTLLEKIRKDIPELANNKEWTNKCAEWLVKKNQKLANSLNNEGRSIGFIRALQHGADPNMMIEEDQLPAKSITFIAANRPPLYLKVLTAYGANPNATMVNEDGKKESLLGQAMHSTDYDEESVKILLEAGADPNTLESNGNPLAFYTIEIASGEDGGSYTHGLEHFIRTKNFNVNAQVTRPLNNNGHDRDNGPLKTQSLLGWAVHWNNFKQAQLLLNAGASFHDLDPVWAALLQENQEQLHNALAETTNYDFITIDQLCAWAIRLKKPRHLETILKDGRFQYIKELLWVMQEAEEQGGPHYLQIIASTPEFKKLAQDHARCDQHSDAITIAVCESVIDNKPENLKILLAASANPNVGLINGMGVIIPIALIAIKNNKLDCLKILLEHGLKPSLEFTDENGHSYSLALWAYNNGCNDAHDMFVNNWPTPQATGQHQTAAVPADQKNQLYLLIKWSDYEQKNIYSNIIYNAQHSEPFCTRKPGACQQCYGSKSS